MPILFTDNSNMFIDHQKGSIGIGTNSSTSNLHVVGQTFLNGNLIVSGVTSITGLSVSGAGITGILSTSSQPNITSVGTLTNLSVAGTGLVVSSNGNVGMGTPSPNANLHVVGPVNLISSDRDTGMFVRLGNVGIGTSTPNANLHVMGYTQIMGTTGNSGLFVDTIGEVGINISVPTSNLHVLGTTQLLGVSGLPGLYISNIGNVGIGTATPNANLHVLGYSQILGSTGSTGLYISNIGNVGIGTAFPMANLHVLGNSQLLNLAGTTGMYVTSLGNIGIGITNPTANLHVIGSSTFLGNVNAGLYISTSGNVGIGTTNPSANLHINTSATNPLNITQSVTQGVSTFTRMTTFMNSSLSTNETTTIQLGQSDAARNCGYLGFTYQSAGSLTNYLTLGLHSVDRVLNIVGTSNVGIGSTAPTNKLDVTGGISTSLFNNFSISTPMATGSTSTTNILTFPSAGVYFLFVSAQGGSSSSTPTTTDNLSHVYLAVVAISTYVVQLTGLYKPNTIFFNVTSTSVFTVNLVINSGSFTYSFYYQKIF